MENRDRSSGAMSRQSQGGIVRPASRYHPLHEMQEQIRRMDAVFSRIFGFEPFPMSARNVFQPMQQGEPDVDIYESETAYIVHAELPGVEPGDIQLEVTDDTITLAAERRPRFTAANANSQNVASTDETATMPHTHHRQSRNSLHSRLRLAYTLPTSIDPDSVRANFRNGMLELYLPKQRPPSSRTVPIAVEEKEDNTNAIRAQAATAPSDDRTKHKPIGTEPPLGSIHEGHPASKMGSTYTPSAGEDHTSQTQSIGARTDHEPGRHGNPIATGQTNPMGTSNAPSPGAPADTDRP